MWRCFWSFLLILWQYISSQWHHLFLTYMWVNEPKEKELISLKNHKNYSFEKLFAIIYTWAKFDCFDGSLSVGMCALNWRLRVTERASLANFDNPWIEKNNKNEKLLCFLCGTMCDVYMFWNKMYQTHFYPCSWIVKVS